MKKKSASRHKKSSSKRHADIFGYCVCKHPAFILSLVVLIAASFGFVFSYFLR